MSPVAAERLRRFLDPRSVAVVGASERQARAVHAIESMRDSGIALHLVNPTTSEVLGIPTVPEVGAIGEPVDAVLCLLRAEWTITAVAEANAAGAGGVVAIAGGFSESGAGGAELERRLASASNGMPLLGPNCNGFVRPATGARLTGAPPLPMPAGGIGVITQTGAVLSWAGLAAAERAVGISTVITTGNELALDLAGCLDFLIDDPDTGIIGLVVETVRDPERFFAACLRAAAAGKPVVALKLGRSARGSEIATSHTGALAGRPWVYQAAFRQHGVGWARDLDDLFDRMAILAQLPEERWSRVEGLGVLSGSGGQAMMASDACEEEGVNLPALTELREPVSAIVPERTTVNPLDMTGFAFGREDMKSSRIADLADVFLDSGHIDALGLVWYIDETADASGTAHQVLIEAATHAAQRSTIPVLLTSVVAGRAGAWTHRLRDEGVAVGRGARATAAGLRTMGDFVRFRERERGEPPPVSSLPRPAGVVVESSAGPILRFDAAMGLLDGLGIPIAPYRLFEPDEEVVAERVGFAGPYVIKLADVPHRTELDAVRVGVSVDDLAEVVNALRAVAVREGAPGGVAVQPAIAPEGEAFVGGQLDGELGPLLLCGLGGVLVETLDRALGGLAPLAPADVEDLLDELASRGVFDGLRGACPWDRAELRRILIAASSLTAGAASWLSSFDVNPLLVTPAGFVAVDGLFLLR